MPAPWSTTGEPRLVGSALQLDRDRLLGQRELGGVVEQVADDLRQPHRIGAHPHRRFGNSHVGRAATLQGRLAQLERARDDVADVDALAAQLDLARGDPRDVEQVVDHPREVRDLALDHLPLAVGRRVAPRHHLERGDDRRERIAQLVAEHREELVLGAVGDLGVAQRVARLAEEADVVERERGVLRELDDAGAVLLAEAAARRRLQRAHRADHAAARDERDDARGAQAEVDDEAAKVEVGEALDVARLEVGEERLAGRDRPRERSRRVAGRDVRADEFAHRRFALGVDVARELALQDAVLVEQVDPADVGDVGARSPSRSRRARSAPRASARGATRR
jgi:hypothetical protein